MASYLPFEQVKLWPLSVLQLEKVLPFFSVYMYCRLIIFVQIVNNAMNCM